MTPAISYYRVHTDKCSNVYTVIHNYQTPFIYYCEINSNEQNFTKLWLQFRHALPH